MSLWKIAWRSMQQRALATSLTGVSMALGVALVVCVLVIHSVVERFFVNRDRGYDMIVGATKGGRLQLVLNTVYHLSQPVENLPYSFYKEFLNDGEHPGKYAKYVDVAVPFCLGDSYQDFRVVGTTPEMFEVWEPFQKYEFAEGRNFDHDNYFEGVIGAVVARATGLKVGDTFQPTHGVEGTEGAHKHDAFTVVGILKPTGTPNDRALFINMEGFYLLAGHAKDEPEGASDHEHDASHGHDEHDEHHAEHGDHDEHDDKEHATSEHGDEHEHDDVGQPFQADKRQAKSLTYDKHDHDEEGMPGHDEGHEHADHEHEDHADHEEHEHGEHGHEHEHAHTPLPESQREITAILVRCHFAASKSLLTKINEGVEAQAVLPDLEVRTLLDMIVGNLRLLLLTMSVLIVIVAGIGIMVSIYNSMSDRRRDIAVMRALGARRATVFSVILLESILVSLGGGAAGWVLGHLLLVVASPFILLYTGFAVSGLQFSWLELSLIGGLILLASVVGYLPALAAYRTDVAKALSAAP
ncbi:MAG TPA: ABC transporter permease [Pirellulales bacterium]|nr:ABC transporter permease [Pirellulales bacterium]